MSTVIAEQTYVRLLLLAPNLDLLSGECISERHGRRSLWLRVIEQTPYSTRCSLTEWSGDGQSGDLAELVVELRVYHDARVADLLSYSNRYGSCEVFDQPVLAGASLSRKRELNFFLWKWLGHCLAHGHRISDRLEELNR